MAAKKVGLKDISERAGVALSTVSHVLNGTAPISDEVRTRVLDVAREMGYLAKRRAKGAIATLTKVLIAVPDDARPDSDVNLVSWTILNALTQDCDKRGVKVIAHALDPSQSPSALVEAARADNVEGIILINDDREALLEAICDSGIPAVLINGEDPNMHVDSVTPGNRFAALKATKVLMGMGHEKIMHLTWRGRQTVRRRRDGFKDAFSEAGVSQDNAVIVMAQGYDPRFGEAAVAEWLATHPDLDGVTAIFCAADNLAFGAIKALKAAGIRVPEDMSVMGFDGVALGELHTPPLTTVSVPLQEFGHAALGLLEQRTHAARDTRSAHRLELGCDVVLRGSVAAPRSV